MLDKHDLHHEFPEFEQEIRQLKMDNAHFARLFKEYHQINQQVHRIEVGVEPTSDEYLEQQKVARLHLKDELFSMLKKAQVTA
ncbi:YdcH family protein [Cognaticolwellia aestuarii]|uniref:YdcH family protein n=1 Tax=Cognaticolwellia aestuarii TaxID=329993 RepID=UPI0009849665|nr:YdcH family protein [Cognaticolwellia aestuarii]